MLRFYRQHYRPDYVFTHRAFFDWNFASPYQADGRSGQRLAVLGSRIVGIMGVLPWPLQVAGQELLGEYNINLFVDPLHRGQSLGSALLENVSTGYRCSLSNGYKSETLSMYQRLGSVAHWRMSRFVKVLDHRQVRQALRDAPRFIELGEREKVAAVDLATTSAQKRLAPPSLSFTEVTRFGDDWDTAWQRLRRRYGLTTWRSSRFLNWRYIDYPYPLYTCLAGSDGKSIQAAVVLRREASSYGPIVRIVDSVSAEGLELDGFAIAEQFSRGTGAVLIDYVASGRIATSSLQDAGYVDLRSSDGATLLPMDFNPRRYRDSILVLGMFRDPDDPGLAELNDGQYYIVKGDGDQDRAN
ncbi:GNAT family N-acetyltransferase [Candidatus Bipolaricaulota bacterium]|nr:GNAT family N-acetyltransferase [Candidatus Bipolaricaulota bacterium]